MRISKLCLVVCAVTLGATSPMVRADDNPAQAAARAALEEQMRALDTQQAPANAPAPTPAPPARPAATAPAQPAPAPPPPAANPPATETNQAAAPAATTQTSNATMAPPAQPPAAAAPAMTPAPTVAPAQTKAPAKPTASSSENSLFGPVPPPSGRAQVGTMSEESTAPAATSAAPTAVQTPAPAPVQSLPMEPSRNKDSAAIPGQVLGLKPIVAPPLPISADRQAQLQALLEKYDAGTITPVQYQIERAKILNPSH